MTEQLKTMIITALNEIITESKKLNTKEEILKYIENYKKEIEEV